MYSILFPGYIFFLTWIVVLVIASYSLILPGYHTGCHSSLDPSPCMLGIGEGKGGGCGQRGSLDLQFLPVLA